MIPKVEVNVNESSFYFTVQTLVITFLNTILVLYYTAFFLNLQIGPMKFDDNVMLSYFLVGLRDY